MRKTKRVDKEERRRERHESLMPKKNIGKKL